MLQTFDSQYKFPGRTYDTRPQLYHVKTTWQTKGLGLLFLVVCNSSAIFANRDRESFLFIVSCWVFLLLFFWISKMSSSHFNSNVKYSLEITVYWSLKGCTCIFIIILVEKWSQNDNVIVYCNHFWDNLSSSKICYRDKLTYTVFMQKINKKCWPMMAGYLFQSHTCVSLHCTYLLLPQTES